MNLGFKVLLLTSVLISLLSFIFPFTSIIFANVDDSILGKPLNAYAYTEISPDGTRKLIIRIHGLEEGETLEIYDIIINRRNVLHNPMVSFDGSFPIEITYDKNVISVPLKGYQGGQLLNIQLETNIGPLFLTVKI